MRNDDLRRLAEASGPRTKAGEWPGAEEWMGQGIGQRSAEWIAAASPSRILALLNERDELRAKLKADK